MSHTKCGVRTGGKPPVQEVLEMQEENKQMETTMSKVPTLQVTFAQNSRRYKMTGFKQVNEYACTNDPLWKATRVLYESRHLSELAWLKLLASAQLEELEQLRTRINKLLAEESTPCVHVLHRQQQ